MYEKLGHNETGDFSNVASYMISPDTLKQNLFTTLLYMLQKTFDWVLYVNSIRDLMHIEGEKNINTLAWNRYSEYDMLTLDNYRISC
jgi:hypothetical protein